MFSRKSIMSLTGTERGRNSGNRVMLPAIFLKCLCVEELSSRRNPFRRDACWLERSDN